MQAPMLQLSNPNIDEAFRTQRGSSFYFCDARGVAGIVILQKLGKVLVHSGDVYVSLRWERGDCIQGMVFLGSHVAQTARRLATSSTARVRSQVSERWRFSSLLRIQTAPGVHST